MSYTDKDYMENVNNDKNMRRCALSHIGAIIYIYNIYMCMC